MSRSIKQLMNLEGRCALITGSTGYIGREIAETLAELGARLYLLDLNDNDLRAQQNDLKHKYNCDSQILRCNLESEMEIRSLTSNIQNLDILVNNAAFVGSSKLQGWSTNFEKQTLDSWDRAFNVNLRAVFQLVKELREALCASNNGSIINISSIYGFIGPDRSIYEGTSIDSPAAYAASKGGLIQFTRWMSTVLAPAVRVNSISPGGIERGQPKNFKDRYIAKTPLKRMGREEDMKGAITYLATDLSAWVTGQNIIVDGGWSAW